MLYDLVISLLRSKFALFPQFHQLKRSHNKVSSFLKLSSVSSWLYKIQTYWFGGNCFDAIKSSFKITIIGHRLCVLPFYWSDRANLYICSFLVRGTVLRIIVGSIVNRSGLICTDKLFFYFTDFRFSFPNFVRITSKPKGSFKFKNLNGLTQTISV